MHCAGGGTHVVHLAARARITRETVADSLTVYRSINTEGTLNFRGKQQRRELLDLFLSAKVHDEGRELVYSITDGPAPKDLYAISN